MRAAVLERIGEPLAVQDVELDAPRPGELLVRIEAAGVCHSDLSVLDGTRPRPTPMVLGHEAAGVVEEAVGVRDVEPGDHVVLSFVPSCGACADCTAGRPALCPAAAVANTEGRLLGGDRRLRRGGEALHHHLGVSAFAERAVVSRASAVVVPRDVPLEVAALFGCAVLTGVGAVLNTAGVKAGESVVVFGLGGVGLSALMGAVLAGASPVIGVDPVESKRALALELGAAAAYSPEQAADAVRDCDYAFEAAGHAAVLAAAYAATGRGGTTVQLGLPHPDQELRIQALSLVAGGKRLVGSYMGDAAPQRDIPRLIRLWRSGRLPVEKLRAGELALERINDAMDALASGSVVRQTIRPHA